MHYPEIALWRAVIAQAMADCRPNQRGIKGVDRRKSYEFLTTPAWLERICEPAFIDSDRLHRRIQAMIEAGEIVEYR